MLRSKKGSAHAKQVTESIILRHAEDPLSLQRGEVSVADLSLCQNGTHAEILSHIRGPYQRSRQRRQSCGGETGLDDEVRIGSMVDADAGR